MFREIKTREKNLELVSKKEEQPFMKIKPKEEKTQKELTAIVTAIFMGV